MINNSHVVAVIFSKNRPMQLDLTLNSLYRHCKDDLPEISVLYKADEAYRSAYDTLRIEHPYVHMVEESSFKDDLLKIVKNKYYILFVTDDTIFVRDFYLGELKDALTMQSVIGLSLRLGTNTEYCYPLGRKQKMPKAFNYRGGLRLSQWETGDADFGYPLELSSSLYTDYIYPLLENLEYKNPNELEALMDLNKGIFSFSQPLLVWNWLSIAFANPVNRVQNVAVANKYGNNPEYSSDSLLTRYLNGDRIDHVKFDNFVPNGCHQEVEFEYGENTNV